MSDLDQIPDDVLLYGAGAQLAIRVGRLGHPSWSSSELIGAAMPALRERFGNDPRTAINLVAAAVAAVEAAPSHLKAEVAREQWARALGD